MKKVFFSLMAALVAIPVFFSCVEKEQELPVIEEKPVVPTEYTYSFDIADGETRARLTEEGVLWDNNDPVGLYVQSGDSPATHMGTEVLVQEGSSPKVVFSTAEPLAAGTQVYAYYPYQAGSAGVDAAKIVFPKTQQGGGVSAMPMAGLPVEVRQGEGANGIIRFLNLGAVIDFRVFRGTPAGEQVQSIRISVTAGTNPISGEAGLDLRAVGQGSEAGPAVTWPEGAPIASSVSLSQTADVAANKNDATPLYMVVAPGTYSGTIAIVTNVATYTYSFTDREFGRNVIKQFNMNLDSSKAAVDERQNWYLKVDSASDLTSGSEYLIVYEGESTPLAFKPILSGSQLTASASNKQEVTVENNRILSTETVEACRVVFESKSGSEYYMKAVAVGDYYFYPDGSEIKATSNKNSATAVKVEFTGSGVVNITAGTSNYFKYSTSSGWFKGSTYNGSRALALYKKLDNGGKSEQHLQFSATLFGFCISGQSLPAIHVPRVPVLWGAYTEVTYSSSNGSVATVDASTGAVTIQGAGNAVITATAAADDCFQAGSASYTVIVQQEPVFNLENDKVAQYLDLVYADPYSPSDYSTTHMSAELQSGNTDQVNRLDWPKPVPVNWVNPASGNEPKRVLVYNCDAVSQTKGALEFEISLDEGVTGVGVYNLIPGRTYLYEVFNGENATEPFDYGVFSTTGRRRMIKVGDSPYGRMYANNCRDFGGQMTRDGRRIKYGKLFRGSNMDQVTSTQRTYLLDYMNIRLDVDLRTTGNDAGQGNNTLNDALHLEEIGGQHTSETFNSWGDFSNQFSGSNGKYYKLNPVLTMVFDAIAAGKGVYVHCKVGADRTGYVCMLLEALLGVEQGWCDVDYELTSFSGAVDDGIGRWRTGTVTNLSNNWYYRTRGNTKQGVDYISSLSGGTYGDTFQAKAVNYVVKTLGIPYEKVQAFQNNMLEDLN